MILSISSTIDNYTPLLGRYGCWIEGSYFFLLIFRNMGEVDIFLFAPVVVRVVGRDMDLEIMGRGPAEDVPLFCT